MLGEKDKTPRSYNLPYNSSIHTTCVNIAQVMGINLKNVFENTFGLKYTKDETSKFLEPSVVIGKQITALKINTALTFATRLFRPMSTLPTETMALLFMFIETSTAIGTGLWRVTEEETMAKLAAYHLQSQLADWTPAKTSDYIYNILPQFVPDMWIDISVERVIELYKNCARMDKWKAVGEYLLVAMTLDTYGEYLFPVTMANVNYFLAVNTKHVSLVNCYNAVTQQSWTLGEVKVIAREKCVFMLTDEYEMELLSDDVLEICELVEDYQTLGSSSKSTCSMM